MVDLDIGPTFALSLVELLELLAARGATQFLVELGFCQSIFEGDSELVFQSPILDSSPCSALGHIIKDTRSIASSLRAHSFSCIRRQGNTIAHALAKRARTSTPLLIWMKFIPRHFHQTNSFCNCRFTCF